MPSKNRNLNKIPPGGAASTMEELLAKNAGSSITSLKKGESLKGKITKLTPSEILLDIKGKTEAIVLENDAKLLRALLQNIKLGDEVTFTVINPETENGYASVSLRKFIYQKIWDVITNCYNKKQPIMSEIKMEIKGGFLVETKDGIGGFLPLFNVSSTERKNLKMGTKLNLYIADVNYETRKLIFSQKIILTQDDFKNLLKGVKEGSKVKGIVSNIAPFGIFLSLNLKKGDVNSIDGIIHISEVSWEKVNNLSEMFEVGQELEAIVIKIDENSKRIELSLKRLTDDPFKDAIKKYNLEKVLTLVVKEISEEGLLIDLNDEVLEGFIRRDKIPVGKSYKLGEKIKVMVSEIDTRKRRLYLAPVLLDKPLMYK